MKYFLILFVLLYSCSLHKHGDEILISGSTTMQPLIEKLAHHYKKQNPGITIKYQASSSTRGFSELINEKCHIAAVSRKMKPEEAILMAEKHNTVGISILIAKDALFIYLNNSNNINNLSIRELKDIYKCKTKNWSKLGWLNKPIKPATRTRNSGTYSFFTDHILEGDDICDSMAVRHSINEMAKYVENDTFAIGYGGKSLNKNIKYSSIENIQPTEKNISQDRYPLTRYLNLYLITTPTGRIKEFIDWVISLEGQKIVKSSGFIPLWYIE